MKKSHKKIIKLDLACGNNKQKGFKGVDVNKNTQADIIHDLNLYPYPFEDNSIDEIFCSHFLEHIDDIILFMNELYRILKPDGIVRFIAPYYTSIRAWQDPTHKRVISEFTFLYYDVEWRKANKLEHYPIKTNFKTIKVDHALSEEFNGKSAEAIMYAVTHYWNVVHDIIVTLQKK